MSSKRTLGYGGLLNTALEDEGTSSKRLKIQDDESDDERSSTGSSDNRNRSSSSTAVWNGGFRNAGSERNASPDETKQKLRDFFEKSVTGPSGTAANAKSVGTILSPAQKWCYVLTRERARERGHYRDGVEICSVASYATKDEAIRDAERFLNLGSDEDEGPEIINDRRRSEPENGLLVSTENYYDKEDLYINRVPYYHGAEGSNIIDDGVFTWVPSSSSSSDISGASVFVCDAVPHAGLFLESAVEGSTSKKYYLPIPFAIGESPDLMQTAWRYVRFGSDFRRLCNTFWLEKGLRLWKMEATGTVLKYLQVALYSKAYGFGKTINLAGAPVVTGDDGPPIATMLIHFPTAHADKHGLTILRQGKTCETFTLDCSKHAFILVPPGCDYVFSGSRDTAMFLVVRGFAKVTETLEYYLQKGKCPAKFVKNNEANLIKALQHYQQTGFCIHESVIEAMQTSEEAFSNNIRIFLDERSFGNRNSRKMAIVQFCKERGVEGFRKLTRGAAPHGLDGGILEMLLDSKISLGQFAPVIGQILKRLKASKNDCQDLMFKIFIAAESEPDLWSDRQELPLSMHADLKDALVALVRKTLPDFNSLLKFMKKVAGKVYGDVHRFPNELYDNRHLSPLVPLALELRRKNKVVASHIFSLASDDGMLDRFASADFWNTKQAETILIDALNSAPLDDFIKALESLYIREQWTHKLMMKSVAILSEKLASDWLPENMEFASMVALVERLTKLDDCFRYGHSVKGKLFTESFSTSVCKCVLKSGDLSVLVGRTERLVAVFGKTEFQTKLLPKLRNNYTFELIRAQCRLQSTNASLLARILASNIVTESTGPLILYGEIRDSICSVLVQQPFAESITTLGDVVAAVEKTQFAKIFTERLVPAFKDKVSRLAQQNPSIADLIPRVKPLAKFFDGGVLLKRILDPAMVLVAIPVADAHSWTQLRAFSESAFRTTGFCKRLVRDVIRTSVPENLRHNIEEVVGDNTDQSYLQVDAQSAALLIRKLTSLNLKSFLESAAWLCGAVGSEDFTGQFRNLADHGEVSIQQYIRGLRVQQHETFQSFIAMASLYAKPFGTGVIQLELERQESMERVMALMGNASLESFIERYKQLKGYMRAQSTVHCNICEKIVGVLRRRDRGEVEHSIVSTRFVAEQLGRLPAEPGCSMAEQLLSWLRDNEGIDRVWGLNIAMATHMKSLASADGVVLRHYQGRVGNQIVQHVPVELFTNVPAFSVRSTPGFDTTHFCDAVNSFLNNPGKTELGYKHNTLNGKPAADRLLRAVTAFEFQNQTCMTGSVLGIGRKVELIITKDTSVLPVREMDRRQKEKLKLKKGIHKEIRDALAATEVSAAVWTPICEKCYGNMAFVSVGTRRGNERRWCDRCGKVVSRREDSFFLQRSESVCVASFRNCMECNFDLCTTCTGH